MKEKGGLTGVSLFFLWFGAAVSVAEMLTGGYLAELGWKRGILAILLGHLVGTVLLALAGLIGFRERLPAIASTRISFGKQGSYLISAINILQLVGWTAIMIIEGGTAMSSIAASLWHFDHPVVMSFAIGALVGLWVFWGVRGFKVINTVAASLLLILTIVMSVVICTSPAGTMGAATGKGAFGMGFELSIIMPLSWFPLISDYTSLAKTKKGALTAPFLGYFIGSCWMYFIGLAGALLFGSPDPTRIMLAANLGLTALAIIGLSTVTTTFLDVYSAGISLLNIFPKISDRVAALLFALVGTLVALIFPMSRYTDFLYLLGSVFSPLIAILLVDYFVVRQDNRKLRADGVATASLVIGISFYYLIKAIDLPVGATLTTIVFTALLHFLLRKCWKMLVKNPSKLSSGVKHP
ncbi:MAG: putative hydroxymethylpyrimidine transporter CytX [Syntrophobacterales bacterium]|nr:putative hydroxymethylpyrimidine transporter CytX [Syntrophobacterales bacterium]